MPLKQIKLFNEVCFITAISSPLWEYTSWGTFEELYKAIVADTTICFHIWDNFHTTALLSLQCSPFISITRYTLALMSYTDEDIVLNPLYRTSKYLLAARFSKDSWHRRLVMHLHWWFTWSTTAECSHSISTAVDFWKSACCCLLHSPVAVQQVVTSFVQICMLMMSSAWRPVEDGNIQPIQLVNSYIQNVTVNNACQQ